MNPFAILSLALVVCAAVANTAHCAEAPALPEGKVRFDSDTRDFILGGKDAGNASVQRVQVSGQPFKRAFRVQVNQKAKDAWGIQLSQKMEALPTGHVMLLSAYVRVINTDNEADESQMAFVLEQGGDKHDKELVAPASAGKEWTRFDYPIRVRRDHANTGTQIALRVGMERQTLEIGGVRLIDFGPDFDMASLPRTEIPAYDGQSPNASWRAPAAERIEKIRKGDLTIQVVDAQGRPVNGAEVSVEMTRHAFGFGCVYNPRRIAGQRANDPESIEYRKRFVELFNVAVDEWAMKWPSWESAENRQWAIESAKWIREQGIDLRGHTMIWPSWRRAPERVKELASDPAALRQAVADHIKSVGTTFAGQVIDWDVVNEPYTHFDMLEILGRDIMAEWFKLAREADPHAVLYLNEAGQPNSGPTAERYDVFYDDIKMLIEKGAPIGGLGMQGHFGQNLNSPEQLMSIYDRFAVFGLPIKITELDIDHPDPQVQADYMRDFLTISFSHPSIDGILMWGFWEGQHHRPSAALWSRDWTIRPVGKAWMDLVRGAWWTREKGTTNSAGELAIRGFLGNYDITATVNGKTYKVPATLTREGTTVRIEAK